MISIEINIYNIGHDGITKIIIMSDIIVMRGVWKW